jgi:acyl-CoA dehydrogenase
MLIQLLLLLIITSYCLYVRKTFQVSLTIIAASLLLLTVVDGFSFVPWLIILVTSISFFMPDFRRQYVSTPVFNIFKKIMPAMSETENDALEAGDVWVDGDLFQGDPDWKKILDIPKPVLTKDEQDFVDNQTEELCSMLDDWQILQDMDLPAEVWTYIKEQGFLGIIIPKEYGGLGFSAIAHSTIVTKISSRSATAAVSVMVPNSLGPAELIIHYGTTEQKQHYLPRLAKGKEIPCFALTGPNAGSDAGAMPDLGIVTMGEYEGKKVLGIEVTWNKRYITLAPIATVLGLAFKLHDPEQLIGVQKDIGITCALIPTDHPGVIVGDRHLPMNSAFMNGPTYGDKVFIPMDFVVGGQEYVGKGWRMLVELLSIGRGISLPAMGAACGKMSYRLTGAYSRVREQFNTSIGNFEGVEESLARIAGLTYRLEAMRRMTANAVDLGVKPAVVSAIAKYHMTEMGRVVINDSMDIHGGRGLIGGERNYLAAAYDALPVSITVEGANILTRNLMIFGQGAVRCHPWVFEEMQAVANKDKVAGLKQFDRAFFSHIGYTCSNLVRTFWLGFTGAYFVQTPVSGETEVYYKQLTRMSSALALISDMAMAIIGGDLKRRERLSARLGDVLSHLYMATSVLKFYEDEGRNSDDLPYVHWNCQNSLASIEEALREFLLNFTSPLIGKALKIIVFPWGKTYSKASDKLDHQVVKPMLCDSNLRDRLTENCYVGKADDDVTGRLENAFIKVLLAADADKKLSRAVKKKILAQESDYDKLLDSAIKSEILTKEEVVLLKDAAAARWDAIQVDAYPKSWFSDQAVNKDEKLNAA